jgi:ribosomal protein L40E
MALVPCKECGTLNSEHAEICLSCEFPTQGRSKKQLWQWVALGMALLIGAPMAMYALDLIKTHQVAPPSTQKS